MVYNCRRFGTFYQVHLQRLKPLKMDLIGSETSAIINQTPGNYPKVSLLNQFTSNSLYNEITSATVDNTSSEQLISVGIYQYIYLLFT